jgi:hypothetical protein
LAKYREKESQVFGNLTALVEDEVSIFARLKIKPQRTREVISDVFNSLISMQDGPSSDNLKVLKGRLELATKLVCKESKGPFRRGVDWVLSWKGATVLGGAALVGANILVFTQAPNHGPVSWKSVKAGLKVMRGELDGLIELLG